MTTRAQSPHFNTFVFGKGRRKLVGVKRLTREEELREIEALVKAGQVKRISPVQEKPLPGVEARPRGVRAVLGI